VPDRIETYPTAIIHQIHYPTMVWYNEAVRREAIAQIRSLDMTPVILVGFSKSGLGAWNIARTIPDLTSCTIIFDAPVARNELPPWGTGPFYATDGAWKEDLPIRSVKRFHVAMADTHSLILIAGHNFRDETWTLSQSLSEIGHRHVFLDYPGMKHHWNSGWIEEGLGKILEQSSAGDLTARAAPRFAAFGMGK
jgi:pimeloyl-ACP methyl ester carboxylesterase